MVLALITNCGGSVASVGGADSGTDTAVDAAQHETGPGEAGAADVDAAAVDAADADAAEVDAASSCASSADCTWFAPHDEREHL